MSRVCAKCKKGSQKSATRSHSHIKTIRRQFANLQKVNGQILCTGCIKTMAKPTT